METTVIISSGMIASLIIGLGKYLTIKIESLVDRNFCDERTRSIEIRIERLEEKND